jgi:hypothetical protein
MKLIVVTLLHLLLPYWAVAGFTILPSRKAPALSSRVIPTSFVVQHHGAMHTRRYALLDVPDNFFTILLPTLSLFLAFSKKNARARLEERAWEQRLEEAREVQLEKDATLTQVDLRRREAAAEWSAYGNNASTNESSNRGGGGGGGGGRRFRRRGGVTMEQEESSSRSFPMTDQEILKFKQEFGVDYDPYYDDPYTEEELPTDIPFKVDKQYGDRIYQDGEVFYKDQDSGLFYRQGSQPRMQKFNWKL